LALLIMEIYLKLFCRFTEENKSKRPTYAYLPFGIGPRICVAMKLALLESKMAIVNMFQKFRFSTCDETEVMLYSQ
jgi:cytochrome P450